MSWRYRGQRCCLTRAKRVEKDQAKLERQRAAGQFRAKSMLVNIVAQTRRILMVVVE